MNHDKEKLLRDHGLRVTPMRLACLEIFNATPSAISSNVLEQALENVDRITLYRTLRSFEESGLIHHAVDANGLKKYALCSDHCDEHEHNHDHLHFHCQQCGDTSCLDMAVPIDFHLPEGYRINELQFNIIGLCPKCA